MSINDERDVEGLKRVGAVVAEARDAMGAHVAPGVTTAELDAIGKEILDRHGARSAPRLAYGFPGVTCISVNDRIAHGIPSWNCVLSAGDLVNIDVSAELDGYWADTGASFPVGTISTQANELLRATRLALADGMNSAQNNAVSKSFVISAGMALDATSTRNPAFPTLLIDGIEPCCEPDSSSQSNRSSQWVQQWRCRTPMGGHSARAMEVSVRSSSTQ
jgi:methionine aminopeptidase type I